MKTDEVTYGEADWIVLALYEGAEDTRMANVVRIKQPAKGKLRKWEPVVGQPIPSGVKVTPEEDYSKVLHVLSEQEIPLMEALHCLSEVDHCGIELEHHIGNMVASAIDGFLGESQK